MVQHDRMLFVELKAIESYWTPIGPDFAEERAAQRAAAAAPAV